MIVLVRGAPGSGKSTVIRKLMRRADAEHDFVFSREKKIFGHVLTFGTRRVMLIGSYRTDVRPGADGMTSEQSREFARVVDNGRGAVVVECNPGRDGGPRGQEILALEGRSVVSIMIRATLRECLSGARGRAYRTSERHVREMVEKMTRTERVLLRNDMRVIATRRIDALAVLLRTLELE